MTPLAGADIGRTVGAGNDGQGIAMASIVATRRMAIGGRFGNRGLKPHGYHRDVATRQEAQSNLMYVPCQNGHSSPKGAVDGLFAGTAIADVLGVS
jgi:hypothetical protein